VRFVLSGRGGVRSRFKGNDMKKQLRDICICGCDIICAMIRARMSIPSTSRNDIVLEVLSTLQSTHQLYLTQSYNQPRCGHRLNAV